ncbi:MAG: acyl-CoA reductase [Anaerolineae bacterium]
MDGFWLPDALQQQPTFANVGYRTLSYLDGQPAAPDDPRAVTARYPDLQPSDWQALLAGLRGQRTRVPTGAAYWVRLQTALQVAGRRLADPADPLRREILTALPIYTGYSEAMIRMTLAALDMMALDQLPAAYASLPTWQAAAAWQPIPGLPGRLRFYPAATPGWNLARFLRRRQDGPLPGEVTAPELVVGYGAGNVPGTALLITFLAQATSLAADTAPPAIVIRNSRQEPLFGPLVLRALAAVDPDLVANVALLIWDFEDERIQALLLAQADLIVAAAGDQTITEIGRAARHAAPAQPPRLHAHGHKVSFAAIGREMLAPQARLPDAPALPLLDVVALLAALDSIFWDQNGCLSARVHFVEVADAGATGQASLARYAERLTAHCQTLATLLPRGAWPRQPLHDRFDRYKALEATGQVRVWSGYDDDFVVVVDERPLPADRRQAAGQWLSQVNGCQGRVIVVRPVANLLEIPERYLALLPPGNLQSLSVAVGQAGVGITPAFLHFAEACGARGVTAIRTVGRGAFPQLAYSWDGLLPLDLVRTRPPGHFTTIEFDDPLSEIAATWQLLQRLAPL